MRPDVVIVGGGIEGLSVAYHLVDRGCGVTVLERGELCSAGTAKSSGVSRCHYSVRSLAAMAWHSVGVLETLGAEAGFHQVGYLVGVGPDNVEPLRHNIAMHQTLGVDVRPLTPVDAQSLWPAADVRDFAAFAYEPRSGYGDAYQLGMTFARLARDGGARIRRHTPVARLLEGHDGTYGVETSSGERLHADLVVLAVGPWSPYLARQRGIDLPIRGQREQIMLVDPGGPLGDVPVFGDLVSLQYVRPEASGELLWGNADHRSPEFTDPDRYSNHIDEEAIGEKITHRFPGLPNPGPASSYAGVYDVTPDYNPVIDEVADGLFVCAGFSGHGFKISPAVGRLVAGMVCDGRSNDPNIDPEDFRLSRFAEGKPLVGEHPYGMVTGHV